ncbi:ferritin-like domain-containing protein [Sphingobacterium sp. UDSM-2020]|uniref:ferritin-like domain-containing protein n=1 Tax=Sphingobacterium sp. UDSM-2020 TaxID=2795738 RepID=UPI001938715C|nr:PA2169 family four-helix-bundle protein [Sphingobacterium sp. UDSM-2020]QQD12745.1 PA2169 family four-helix-bundle protein [Sphingobacterium sp. UDSM-2020]
MENNFNNPDIINDLIKINNDRIAGYKRALDLAHGLELDTLRQLFANNILQSERFIEELKPYVLREGEKPTDETMLSGKLFRMWMSIKGNIVGNDRYSLLESCEKGEDAFKEMYKKILVEDVNDLSLGACNKLLEQLSKQSEAHNEIKSLRDNVTL